MRMALEQNSPAPPIRHVALRASAAGPDAGPSALQSESVLSVLEADQLVAAKQKTHFGLARLTAGARVLLWGLRVYVIVMLIIVARQVTHVFQGGH